MKIKALFNDSQGCYGAIQIQQDLIEDGSSAAINTISNSIHRKQLFLKPALQLKVTTNSDHQLSVADNMLKHDFSSRAPLQKWVQCLSELVQTKSYN